MKNRFSTLDLIAILPEIREKLVGMRVNQVYDVDAKTVIFRFSNATTQGAIEEESMKQMLILESGIRIHLTEYDWPKNSSPSGFTMKLRKHIRNKRLECIKQVGNDRIVDLQFGTNDYTNHIILELFSKGNIILTDKDYTILSLVRFYKDPKTNINIAVWEKYPLNQEVYISEHAKMTADKISDILKNSKETNFKKLFNPRFVYGPSLLEHSLLNFKEVNVNKFKVTPQDVLWLEEVFQYADSQVQQFQNNSSKGYIVVKREKRVDSEEDLLTFDEFHPFLFNQFKNESISIQEYESFNKAVDVFFSSIESQKIQAKSLHNEKQALKKLDAIKKDHESRLENLAKMQEFDNKKAQLIENNVELVEQALSVLRSAIANRYSWEIIAEMVKDAQDSGDLIASRIKALKLEKNCFTMSLDDPYEDQEEDSAMLVDIDLALSAHANARRYYVHRKDAAKKEQKTIDHSQKAFKNVERKVRQQLKETSIKANIVMARKVLWFEKFFWFISSEGFLMIAGRDAQQNELIVKRYLETDDIYVHADIHGATSVVIKNHTGSEVPPKTLNEAANMAICYSASWEAKVVSNAYWVRSDQVQKTAPSGQYLGVGSFMIRGKKNYIPLQNLILGFGIVFRIDEESVQRRHHLHDKDEPKLESSAETNDPEMSNYPDTTVKFNATVCDDEAQEVEQESGETDYTIVTTGDIKKKVKIFTQQSMAKKTQQHSKNLKKAEKMKGKRAQQNAKQLAAVSCSQKVEMAQNEENPAPIVGLEDSKQAAHSEVEPETATSVNGCEALVEPELDGAEDNDDEIDDDEPQNELSKKGVGIKKLIDSLVSVPLPEDNTLFAIPVCGPYSSMHNYKYKVKIIPGSTKRGRAAKTALAIFLKEKTSTEREKDLLKALKDQDISKNMPGKVKLVTSNINK